MARGVLALGAVPRGLNPPPAMTQESYNTIHRRLFLILFLTLKTYKLGEHYFHSLKFKISFLRHQWEASNIVLF